MYSSVKFCLQLRNSNLRSLKKFRVRKNIYFVKSLIAYDAASYAKIEPAINSRSLASWRSQWPRDICIWASCVGSSFERTSSGYHSGICHRSSLAGKEARTTKRWNRGKKDASWSVDLGHDRCMIVAKIMSKINRPSCPTPEQSKWRRDHTRLDFSPPIRKAAEEERQALLCVQKTNRGRCRPFMM